MSVYCVFVVYHVNLVEAQKADTVYHVVVRYAQ